MKDIPGQQVGKEDQPLQAMILGRLQPAVWEGNWAAICQQAQQNGLAPLLYWRLAQAGWPGSIPLKARSTLQARYIQSAAANSLYFSTLDKIQNRLELTGIRFLPLKGARLACWLYPDPTLRPMSDLDLLVHPADLPQAVRLFRVEGFDVQKTTYHLLMAGGKRQEIAFEIHWSLPGGQALPGWMWAAVSQAQGEMDEVVFHLLYLAVHLAGQHAQAPRLIWTYDLHLLLERYGQALDAEQVRHAARELGWQPALNRALWMTHQAWGTPLPGLMCTDEPGSVKEISAEEWRRKALRLLPARLRLGFLVSYIFPSRGYIQRFFHPRPAWTWPLYYPARWLGLGERIHREH
jgi:hypothetical protein